MQSPNTLEHEHDQDLDLDSMWLVAFSDTMLQIAFILLAVLGAAVASLAALPAPTRTCAVTKAEIAPENQPGAALGRTPTPDFVLQMNATEVVKVNDERLGELSVATTKTALTERLKHMRAGTSSSPLVALRIEPATEWRSVMELSKLVGAAGIEASNLVFEEIPTARTPTRPSH